ncbi:hypothetical protein DHB64_07925 [Antarcticibacterium sp. W02-3]|nr:hypothetical protein [Antarcticibacterium sp. W02-3]
MVSGSLRVLKVVFCQFLVVGGKVNLFFFEVNYCLNTELKGVLKRSCSELSLDDSPPAEGCLKGGVGTAGD